jgi:hypothetical protein
MAAITGPVTADVLDAFPDLAIDVRVTNVWRLAIGLRLLKVCMWVLRSEIVTMRHEPTRPSRKRPD